ncbi:S66 peptidase family protein [Bacillus massiliigorillae]|uniref:S66 peptidase family protein n=1 Tax=Bacillus massiliigorillae TaxID=1243664 RepID=UPI0003A29BEB|nr:LD-carboxypeptidase [Bacillus massiliigorillae]
MLIKPPMLKKGDIVGVIAPASPPNQENLQRGIVYLESLGVRVKMGKNVYKEYGYLAGSDDERLEDLHAMFADCEVRAIVSAGGGYGTGRIASRIDYNLIRNNPKIFWGYSDLTFLHTAIRQCSQLVTFHGPMLASDIGKSDFQEVSSRFFQQLFHANDFTYDESISPIETPIEGSVTGELVGGNLSLLVTTLGTPFEIDTRGKILFIEDVNEEPRNIDRMLNHLYMAGKLTNISGLVVGDFHNCVPGNRVQSLTLEEVLQYYIALINKPTLKGLKMGHCSPHVGVPLGTFAKLCTKHKQLIVESGVCAY